MSGRVLVAGLGNVFLGDDGFGVEVVRRLARDELPPHVAVKDFGTGSVHLAYELASGYELAVIVDAVAGDDPPGTISLIEPDAAGWEARPAPDGHGLDPDGALRLVEALGGGPGRILVVGCRPGVVEERLGLSGPVERAVGVALDVVKGIISAGGGRREAGRREEG